MANNVQWIKLKVGMFDGNSFKKIKRAKIGGVSYRDKLTAVWFELLDLAGKSNSNGYLIDTNEIPYNSFEEIAIMLDRDDKEIELCMQFFINEKMIEIVDDIYCLTNFVKYQNLDGLLKVREQRRVAQAKWRERRKLGLIEVKNECGVDEKTSTQTSTHNLPSYSHSYSYNNNSHQYNDNDSSYNNERAHTREEGEKVGGEPTLAEIKTFAKEKGLSVNAESFYNYYTAAEEPEKRWVDANGKKVLDWRQKIVMWDNFSKQPQGKRELLSQEPTKEEISVCFDDINNIEI